MKIPISKKKILIYLYLQIKINIYNKITIIIY